MRSLTLTLFFVSFLPFSAQAAVPQNPSVVKRLVGMGHPRDVKEAIRLAGKIPESQAKTWLLAFSRRSAHRLSAYSFVHLMRKMKSTADQHAAGLAYIEAHAGDLTVDQVLEVASGITALAPPGHAFKMATLDRAAKQISNVSIGRAIAYDAHPNDDVHAARAQLSAARSKLHGDLRSAHEETDRLYDDLLLNFWVHRNTAVVGRTATTLSSDELMKLADHARTEHGEATLLSITLMRDHDIS